MGISRRHLDAVLTSCLFFVALIVPAARQWQSSDVGATAAKAEHVEGRKLTNCPRWEWKWSTFDKFPSKFEAYFSDHFGLRRELIDIGAQLKTRLFSTTNTSNVLLGKNDWLFYSGPMAMEASLGTQRLTEAQLQSWLNYLHARQDWLAARGSQFLFVVVPEKSTVYREYLPDRLQGGPKTGPTDQLVDRIRQDGRVRVVDLRPALLAAKDGNGLYCSRDSHWNHRGAGVAASELLKTIREMVPSIDPVRPGELPTGNPVRTLYDLERMLGETKSKEVNPICLLQKPTAGPPRKFALAGLEEFQGREALAFQKPDRLNSGPKLLMFRDSFGTSLAPFLAEAFAKSLFFWRIDEKRKVFEQQMASYVESEKPEIFIEETVERYVLLPPNPKLTFGEGLR